jgi:hypothetical protein
MSSSSRWAYVLGVNAAAIGGPERPADADPRKPKRHKTKKKAHKAQGSTNTCQLEADVTVIYSAS